MNRRHFLRSFAAVPVVAAVVPELLKTIILPPHGGWPSSVMRGDFRTANMRYVAHERTSATMMSAADFRRQLAAGLNQVFTEAYREHEEEYLALFG